MGFRYRKRLRFGPLHVNISRSGVSTSLTAGGMTVNPKRRSLWVNLPGGWFWTRTAPKHRAPRRQAP